MRPRPVFLASRPRPGRGLNIPDSNKCQCEVTISMSRAACRQVCCEFHSHWSPSAWLVHTRHLTVLPHRSNSCLIITHICVDWTLLASYKSCSKHLNPVQPHTGYYSLINSLLHHMVATLKPFIPTSVAKMSPPKHSASYWSNPPFLFFDIRALWRSVLSSGGSRVGGSLGSDEPPPPSDRIRVWWLKTLELVVSAQFTKRHFYWSTQSDMATQTHWRVVFARI